MVAVVRRRKETRVFSRTFDIFNFRLNKEYSNLWRVFRTVNQMLRDRKYVVADEMYDMEYNDFVERFESVEMATENKRIRREDLTVRSVREDDDEDIIFVFFSAEKRVGVDHISSLMKKIKADGANRAILIVHDKITPFAKKVATSAAPEYIIELFDEIELLINVTRHIYVPKHVLLTEEEKKDLLEKYMLKETQLSRILITDPIARYYGLARRQVVKIIRPSETAGRYVTYRIVV